MKKSVYLLTTLLILASASVCYAANWQEITTFNGTADQTTDYFNVPTSEWRITWSYTASAAYPDLSALSVYAYPKGESAMYSTMILKTGANETSGTTYVHEGAKDYYLKIGCANLQGYIIKIEYDTTSTVPEFSSAAIIGMLVAAAAMVLIVTKKGKIKKA